MVTHSEPKPTGQLNPSGELPQGSTSGSEPGRPSHTPRGGGRFWLTDRAGP